MGWETEIAWCDATLNLWIGCSKISEGCKHCYAERIAKRMGYRWNVDRVPCRWREKLRAWEKKAHSKMLVFVGSMMDWADDDAPQEERQEFFRLARGCRNLVFLMLTKRANNIGKYLPADWGQGYQNIWLGVTCESTQYAWRIEALRKIPAVCRFVSYEPAIGPLDADLTGIHWLIYGGESGPGYRQDKIEWAIMAHEIAKDYGVRFFFKQRAGLRPGTGDNHGLPKEWPDGFQKKKTRNDIEYSR